jgi:hypothetical protein
VLDVRGELRAMDTHTKALFSFESVVADGAGLRDGQFLSALTPDPAEQQLYQPSLFEQQVRDDSPEVLGSVPI